jgi:hypothetical protein
VTQAIGLLGEIFGAAAIVALSVALAIAAGGSRLIRSGRGSDFVLPCALVIGFFAGYLMLPRSFAALVPQPNQPWQWLPYFAAITAILSASLSPLSRPAAWIFPLVVSACIEAAVFAPSWPIFGLTQRPLHLVVALYLVLVGGPLLYLPSKVGERWLLPSLALSGAITAVVVGAMVSTRLAGLVAVAAGAFAAAAIFNTRFIKASDRSRRSVVAVFAILAGGSAWLAFTDPDPPRSILLFGPLLPLLLWPVAVIRVPSAGGKIG